MTMTKMHRRAGTAALAAAVALLLAACSNSAVATTNVDNGKKPTTGTGEKLAPFVWGKDGGKIPDLPNRMAWANTSNAEFFLAFSKGMEEAAKDRGVDYVTAIADDNPQKNIDQMNSFRARGVGALMYQPLDMASQTPVLNKALQDGVFVPGLISYPSTLQIAASQYAVGYMQGKAAADWAKENLDGKAQVHYFNLDNLSEQLVLRHKGVLAGLATGGDGIKVVSDLTTKISTEDGFSTMNTVLQAHPDVDIVLGGDTLVIGALKAMQQNPNVDLTKVYLSGVDGDSQALAEVKKGGPYKASIAFAWQLMGYGIGQFSADWLKGKEVPRVMVAAPTLLDSPAKVDEFIEANAHPAAVFQDHEKFEKYLPLLGQISYATRENVWTSEYVPEG